MPTIRRNPKAVSSIMRCPPERSDCVVGVQNPIAVIGQCVDFRLHFFDLFFVSVLLSCSSPHMQLSQLVTHLEQ